MSTPRPKPWEVSEGTSAAAVNSDTPTLPGPPPTTNSLDVPSVDYMTEDANSLNQANRGMENNYNNDIYGGGGYNRYGSSLYGGGLGYGGGFGSFGGYGGYGGYGMSPYGMMNNNMMMNNGSFGQLTQATFQLIEGIIGAVGGFAQMLEATYMATQSSFYTMMSVGEQFGNLKNALGQIFGIFTVLRYLKKLLHKITGLKVFKDKVKFSKDEFMKFNNENKERKNRISLKPLIFFIAATFGIPYLLRKLFAILMKQNQLTSMNRHNASLKNPKSIEFCRALYDFNPEDQKMELQLKKGQLYAIVSRTDSKGNPAKWWSCRNKNGDVGYAPYNFLEVIDRNALNKRAAASKPLNDQTS